MARNRHPNRASIFGIQANPEFDAPIIRKSIAYCQGEVLAGRAKQVDPKDITKGIKLTGNARSAAVARAQWTEVRGSRERSNCLTARESQLNSEYRGPGSNFVALSREYETRLEKHILAGRKGTPRSCDVIAARVKTLLSEPEMRCVSNA